MENIESLSSEIGKSPLMEQANSFDILPLEQLNAPLDAGASKPIESFDTKEFKDSEMPSTEELNKPILNDSTEADGLTAEQKAEIKEKTGWSNKIVDSIRSMEEASIYMDAGLVEGEVNGKPALLQPNIDWDAENSPWEGYSNRDLASEGYAPRDEKGQPYELHHIGQNPDSPLAELTYEQHRGGVNFKILHSFDEPSRIDRQEFGNNERPAHWMSRYENL